MDLDCDLRLRLALFEHVDGLRRELAVRARVRRGGCSGVLRGGLARDSRWLEARRQERRPRKIAVHEGTVRRLGPVQVRKAIGTLS